MANHEHSAAGAALDDRLPGTNFQAHRVAEAPLERALFPNLLDGEGFSGRESVVAGGLRRSSQKRGKGRLTGRTRTSVLEIPRRRFDEVDLQPKLQPRAVEVTESRLYSAAKRALDIIGSVVAILLAAPIFLAASLLVRCTDGGPAIYAHTRVGKNGREFRCFKFRSMVLNADQMKQEMSHLNSHDDHRTFKVPNDPRVTWVGKLLRRASLDELPQLFNVLLGDMSLVGPRPPVPNEVALYSLDDMQRLVVKPGLTCIWQVSGRSKHPFPEQLEMDLDYIENRSLWLDVKLILLTVPAVLSADGAY